MYPAAYWDTVKVEGGKGKVLFKGIITGLYEVDVFTWDKQWKPSFEGTGSVKVEDADAVLLPSILSVMLKLVDSYQYTVNLQGAPGVYTEGNNYKIQINYEGGSTQSYGYWDDGVLKFYPSLPMGMDSGITLSIQDDEGVVRKSVLEFNTLEAINNEGTFDFVFTPPINTGNVQAELLFAHEQEIVLHVPEDYSTIQAAVNASYDITGLVTIVPAPGVYYENIDFQSGGNITIRAEENDMVSVDGGDNGNTFYLQKDDRVVFENLTIISSQKHDSWKTAAVFAENATAIVINCRINTKSQGVVTNLAPQTVVKDSYVFGLGKKDEPAVGVVGIVLYNQGTLGEGTGAEISNNIFEKLLIGIDYRKAGNKIELDKNTFKDVQFPILGPDEEIPEAPPSPEIPTDSGGGGK
ncbi:MAG: right-handed parallel beta-helix repeat-containing protein [Patescibacteria group bacterium]